MRMQLYVLLVTLLVFQKSYCQEIITDSTVILKEGIYKNFRDFKYNNPTYDTISFYIREKKNPLTSTNHISYKLDLENPRSLSKRDSVWGFCDGENIYVSKDKSLHHSDRVYEKLEYIGRYCLFQSVEVGNIHMAPHIYVTTRVMNINNGQNWILSKPILREIVSKDPSMYVEDLEYEDFKEFVIKYSKKHPEEIKR